jgi:hypothetical protein
MLIRAEGLIEDGFGFFVFVGVLAFFWFHGWRRIVHSSGVGKPEAHKKAA